MHKPDEFRRGLAQALRAAIAARQGLEVSAVEHVETHLSHLLLAGDTAYKLKKPIRLPFADFRSVDARRHYCEEELRLNRRLAPALYRDVLPVRGTAQAPCLGQSGERGAAIDWVLRMRRFDSGSELGALLQSETRVDTAQIDAFAARIAQFHAEAPQAPTTGEGAVWGTAGQVEGAIGDVFATLGTLVQGEDAGRLRALRDRFDARRDALVQCWARRRAGGHVREGHGDLHLGNVVCLDGVLTAFDCIEFSPTLRWTDTMADAGFFTMDLHAHGRPDLAWRFLDAYLAATGDYGGLDVLRSYEVYRALVRAMAERLRVAQGATPQSGPDYLACAEALVARPQPRLLITHGLSGSGKSTVAAQLLAAAGAVRLRSDVERKRLHGLALLDDSTAHGLNIYTPEATARTFAHLAGLARTALLAGYPVIVDAAFLRRAEREIFRDLAWTLDVPFTILHCHTSMDQLQQRVTRRRVLGTDPSEADLPVLARQQVTAEPLAPDEAALAIDVDTGAGAVDAHVLAQRWLSATGQPA